MIRRHSKTPKRALQPLRFLVHCVRSELRRLSPILLLVLLLSPPSVASAQLQKNPDALYAVVHIDLDSSRTPEGLALVEHYVAACLQTAGNLSMQLLQERGRPNHLTLIEGWRSEASYTTHLQSTDTKTFRSRIQPLLGSPFDERLHSAPDR